jgi:hypothetical protein
MQDLRSAAMDLLEAYLPCNTGDPRFAEIAKDFGGMGTTCGYLTGWLLWKLGCVDPRIVNREEPEDGLHYAVGMNIARLVQGAKSMGAWRTLGANGPPKPGDLVYYAKDPPEIRADGSKNFKEHVNVAVSCPSGGVWRTGDAGRTNMQTGQQMAEFVDRKQFANGSIDYLGGPRQVFGYVDLLAVPYANGPQGGDGEGGEGFSTDWGAVAAGGVLGCVGLALFAAALRAPGLR